MLEKYELQREDEVLKADQLGCGDEREKENCC
jgi:hypothetical protein